MFYLRLVSINLGLYAMNLSSYFAFIEKLNKVYKDTHH